MEFYHSYLFPTVCTAFDLTNKYDPDAVVKSIEDSKKDSHALITNGVRSLGNNFLDDHIELKTSIEDCLKTYIQETGVQNLKIAYSWFNIYKNTGYIRPHRHELSVMSGVFYPYVSDFPNAGSFVVESPLSPFKVNELGLNGNTAYNQQRHEWPVKQGLLLIFPSWLQHYSEGNISDKRYAISFDTRTEEYV